jgi:hypothetical protein
VAVIALMRLRSRGYPGQATNPSRLGHAPVAPTGPAILTYSKANLVQAGNTHQMKDAA